MPENNRVAVFKQPLILPFLCHKSSTTYQIDSYQVSNSKLKIDLCNCVTIKTIESTAPPQQPLKWSTIFETPCRVPQHFPFSALDAESERIVQDALDKVSEGIV